MNIIQGSAIPQVLNISNPSIKKEDDNSEKSYFFKAFKHNEGGDKNKPNNNLLDIPDIHGNILSFLDKESLKNMRLINRATRQFIDENNSNRNFSLKLRNSCYARC